MEANEKLRTKLMNLEREAVKLVNEGSASLPSPYVYSYTYLI